MLNFFQDADIITAYTLSDAIADGSIICLSDMPEHAQDVKTFYKCPVYVTGTVYSAHETAAQLCHPASPENAKQLMVLSIFDMLNMSRMLAFELSPNTKKFSYHLQDTADSFAEETIENLVVAGPDDNGGLIITFMHPSEN